MRAGRQTEKNVSLRKHVGVIARAALIERGHIGAKSLDPFEHEGPAPPVPEDIAADFRWYFDEERNTGAATGGGSNFNAMLDRMALYAKEGVPCTSCGGVKEVRDKSGTVLVDAKPGSGRVTSSKPFKEWERIAKLCGRPTDLEAVRKWLDEHNPAVDQDDDGNDRTLDFSSYTCSRCKGWGVTFRWRKDSKRPVTVNITGETPRNVPVSKVGGSKSMARHGAVARRRALLRSLDPLSEAAAEAHFSPDGTEEFALWHLTPTGQLLLDDRDRRNPQQAFRALLTAQASNRDPVVERRIQKAKTQSRQLLSRMARFIALVVDA